MLVVVMVVPLIPGLHPIGLGEWGRSRRVEGEKNRGGMQRGEEAC